MSTQIQKNFLNAAKSQLDVRYAYQQSTVNVGMDCVGLIKVSLELIGVKVSYSNDYYHSGHYYMDEVLAKYFPTTDKLDEGNILTFRYDQGNSGHIAIATDDGGIIHAIDDKDSIVKITSEALYNRFWASKVHAIYNTEVLSELNDLAISVNKESL